MNRASRNLAMLEKMAEVRKLQRKRADLVLADRAQALKALQEDCGKAEGEIATAVEDWRAHTASKTVPLELTGLLVADIGRQVQALAQLEHEASQARETQAQAETDWRSAIARADCAEKLVNQAARDLDHRRAEKALNENADRFLHRSWS